MTVEKRFEEWFDGEVDKGLIDLKLDVRAAPESTTPEEVLSEILTCEQMIEDGLVEDLPLQTTKCSPEADAIICKCLFDAKSNL